MNQDKMAKARRAKKAQRQNKPEITVTMTEERAELLKRVSRHAPTMKSFFINAYSGKSKAAGIKAKCLECTNLDRSFVRDCHLNDCPLWAYRPYRQKNIQKEG